MKRPLHIWLGFVVCLGVVLTAMGWISATVLRLDAAEENARRQAVVEENVRLALWRMDSSLAPLIAQESARTYFAYRPFYPAERAYNKMFAEIDFGEVLMPSDLLNRASPHVLLHFQFDPEGKLTSPQVPTGNELDLAEGSKITTWQNVKLSCDRLGELQKHLNRQVLLDALEHDASISSAMPPLQLAMNDLLNQQAQQLEVQTTQQEQPAQPQQQERGGRGAQLQQQIDRGGRGGQQGAEQQAANPNFQVANGSPNAYGQTDNNDQYTRNSVEFNKRVQSTRLGNVAQNPAKQMYSQSKSTPPEEVKEGVARPLWIGDALLLARRVSVGRREYIQGCWLDWPAIRDWLAADVADLLPGAQLLPVGADEIDPAARRLAALPVHLIPGEVFSESIPFWTPMRMSLAVAWTCVLLAAAAVAVLLAGVVSLSERRGAFVSAVTHELRTPLTTFRMYTEMLADGMVQDEAQRKSYLGTLQTEANRLAHLVENVLAYARIERGNLASRRELMTGEQLLTRVESRLFDRARQAGLDLSLETSPEALSANTRCDASAVEQILFNLIDNACKYAGAATEKKLHLAVERQGKWLALRVRDHGPGITDRERWRLFRPFCKSATDAAHSAPGVGLGLSLSRRLARDMRGDLRLCDAPESGACFLLTLPIEG
jgi:signal transduction histidine kinase